MKCNFCGKLGHIERDCYTKRIFFAQLVEEYEDKGEATNEDKSSIDEAK